MDRSTPITLIRKAYTSDSIGQMIPIETTAEVYADIKSVSRAEFFAAGEKGLNPELVATMFAPDYSGEDTCEIENNGVKVRYSVYRTYLARNDSIELYLEKRVGNE